MIFVFEVYRPTSEQKTEFAYLGASPTWSGVFPCAGASFPAPPSQWTAVGSLVSSSLHPLLGVGGMLLEGRCLPTVTPGV